MEINQRIQDFAKLGEILAALGGQKSWPGIEVGLTEEEYDDLTNLVKSCKSHNGWFTEESVCQALNSWSEALTVSTLSTWTADYPDLIWSDTSVAVIMAGNIPMVGFHDMLSVLISGKRLLAKTSSDDTLLMRALGNTLVKLNEVWNDRIRWADGKLTDYGAVIATGSNNSARYFEQYFSDKPHIIRKNRNGVALLDGQETEEEMVLLGKDVFDFYGLGCRNVSKVYIPRDFDLDRIFKGLFPYSEVINHNKYANNYDYHKAIYMLNEDDIIENGFMLMKEVKDQIASPVATLLYERYDDEQELRKELSARADEIQCIVSHKDLAFGQTQNPALSDYADGVDSLDFLQKLN
jgi:hypothetical protein